MKRSLTLVAMLCCFVACEREPDELLFVVGKVTDVAGQPLRGQPVELFRNAHPDCVSQFYNAGSFPGFDAGTYASAGRFETNDAGDYLFELTVRDSRSGESYHGAPACFQVQFAREGASTTVSFIHPGSDVELVDLPLPSVTPQLSSNDQGLIVEGALPDLSTATAQFAGWDLRSGEELAWISSGPSPTSFSDELLEDFGALSVRYAGVALEQPGRAAISFDGYLEYWMELEGPPVEVASRHRVPLSRGASCPDFLNDAGTCSLTDGRLESQLNLDWDPTLPTIPLVEALRLELEAPQELHRIIIRGLRPTSAGRIRILGSLDGLEWEELASVTPDQGADTAGYFSRLQLEERRAGGMYLDLPLTSTGPKRYVEIRGTSWYPPDLQPPPEESPLHFHGASELSLY